MKTLFALIIGAVIGIAVYIYYLEPKKPAEVETAKEKVSESAGALREKWNQSFTNLNVDEMKSELKETGKVVRKKAEAAGQAISDATADARTTAEIKSKLAVERDLSALRISVNTTDGVVTLAGTVPSHSAAKKAMQIALEPKNAREVVSTLQVQE